MTAGCGAGHMTAFGLPMPGRNLRPLLTFRQPNPISDVARALLHRFLAETEGDAMDWFLGLGCAPSVAEERGGQVLVPSRRPASPMRLYDVRGFKWGYGSQGTNTLVSTRSIGQSHHDQISTRRYAADPDTGCLGGVD
jgi:hypothetical protein